MCRVSSLSRYETFLRREKCISPAPCQQRLKYPPMGKALMKIYYWDLELSEREIAELLQVSKGWVGKEITRLGLRKKHNGKKLKGKRGYEMPWLERLKHKKQPHAKRIAKVCPESMERVEIYTSVKEASRDGYRRDRINKAIDRKTKHRGFLWEVV